MATGLARWIEEDRGYETPCRIWTGSCNQYGYAVAKVAGKNVAVHRALFEAEVGPIPEGMTLDHLCLVHPCVRSDHLEIVTRGENARRGLQRLTQAQAEEIRRLVPSTPIKELVRRFGVSRTTIRNVKDGMTYR